MQAKLLVRTINIITLSYTLYSLSLDTLEVA